MKQIAAWAFRNRGWLFLLFFEAVLVVYLLLDHEGTLLSLLDIP